MTKEKNKKFYNDNNQRRLYTEYWNGNTNPNTIQGKILEEQIKEKVKSKILKV